MYDSHRLLNTSLLHIHLTVADLATDLMFAITSVTSTTKADQSAGIAAFVFVFVPLLLNCSVVVRFMREKLDDKEFHEWARRNATVNEIIQFLAILSPQLLRVISR
jgi:hypothetical protein